LTIMKLQRELDKLKVDPPHAPPVRLTRRTTSFQVLAALLAPKNC